MSAVRIITAVIGALALAWLVRLLVWGEPLHAHWALQVALAAGALLSSAIVCVQQYAYWHRPARRLEEGIREVLAGRMAIDELSGIGGGLRGLVPAVQDALRQVKVQRCQLNLAHSEMRQRILNRTDALERTIARLRQQASRDPLTGLYNRRLLQEHLPELVERCAADRTPLALLMIDVDHFKHVNDTLGHVAGDRLLVDVGQILRSAMRDEDLAFRFGGDEFVIVLPGQTRPQAESLARRLGALMDSLARTLHVPVPPRLSIGVAMLDEVTPADADALLAEADRRLYALKHARPAPRTSAA